MSDALRRALRISVPLVVGLLAIACFLRIDYVNAHAPQIVEENYENADWVDLDGSFAGLADEKTNGLSLKLESSQIMSPKQFLEAYGEASVDLSKDILGKYDDIKVEEADTLSVLVVKLAVKCAPENSDGYFAAIDWRAISSKNPSLSMQPDWDLWEISDPKMTDQSMFRIEPGTEFDLVVPFSIQAEERYFEASNLRTRLPLKEGEYKLVVTNSPIRKIILFSAGYRS